MTKHIAVYVRVSSKQQDQRSQAPDLKRWADAQEGEVVWYRDKFTGKTMNRPGMQKVLAAVEAGRVGSIVVWRLDRLGRTRGVSLHSSRICVNAASTWSACGTGSISPHLPAG